MLDEQLDFTFEEKKRSGVSPAIALSIVLHTLFLAYIIYNYNPITAADRTTPMVRYVELIRQNKEFTEAPGPRTDTAPITAPYSDANRKASMPEPTGDMPTKRPGEGGFYTPPKGEPSTAPALSSPATPAQNAAPAAEAPQAPAPTFAYRPQQANAASGTVNWNAAIREVGKIASIGTGQHGIDLGGGGEKGFAESGPVSFETQWYDWGEYAQSMVSKIRVNWYNNMPQLIQTGMKGVVTIRFTIQRDGRITNLEILSTSTVPPYDFAAKKAIELSSALPPLPKDFPNATERVTCMFFYNQEPPAR
jgi:protein TonB